MRQFQISRYHAQQPQRLRNVSLHSASIVQVVTGKKRLYWRDNNYVLSSKQLLLCGPNSSLSFENQPLAGRFHSQQFSFYYPPSQEQYQLSLTQAQAPLALGQTLACQLAIVPSSPTLQQLLTNLSQSADCPLSQKGQQFLLLALYQHLAELGLLHRLFSQQQSSFEQQLIRFLAVDPSQDHQLESISAHFAISRATLIRRLKQEGTQFRTLLTEVRLSHAIGLMQDGHYPLEELAARCGYQSQRRFSQKFRAQFGLSPHQYMQTLRAAA